MSTDESPAESGGNWSRATQDAAVEGLRQGARELHKLRRRNAQLETALTRAESTAQLVAEQTDADNKRRNVNDVIREALITSLQTENKKLLIRIDKDVLSLASAEERLRELSMEPVLAHEQEQRRLARELHDELGQELTALKILTGRGKTVDGEKARELLAEAGQVVESMLRTVRDICSRLRPQALDDLGLIAGLSTHLKNFERHSGLTLKFEPGVIEEQRLTPIIQTIVFRVIQEAVTNVVRHANTQHARVTLAMDRETLVFSVKDQGCGFDPERVKKSETTGLSGMVERLLLVDGTCEIVSIVGRGTTITGRIPLHHGSRSASENTSGQQTPNSGHKKPSKRLPRKK